MPQKSLEELDVLHRKHLRTILNIKWPTGVISNRNLYERCKVTPLSKRVCCFRWRMLGHILRGAEASTAYLSILFAVNADSCMLGRLGRPCLNLLDIIRKDLVRKNINNKLKTITDFNYLRLLALDRDVWKNYEKL